ncbi:fimbrial protein [Enterobacter sp. 118C5]|uniref:fimbrial protein n=1 Tax=Enterobacter TaxID=547 RepID=UPI002A805072|nr:fimbrial protein [Enterobacter sp. 118C5]
MRFLMKCYLLFFLFISFGVNACVNGYADTDPVQTASFTSVIAQRDTPVGSVIATTTGTPAYPGFYYYNSGGECDLYAVMKYHGAIPTSLENVFETNVPGVGIRASIFSWSHGGGYATAAPGTLAIQFPGSGGWGVYPPKIELVKTGNITSGMLDAGALMTLQSVNNDNTAANANVTWSLSSAAQITQVACEITSGNSLSFELGNVQAGQFTSVGTISDKTSTLDLKLNCDANANVNLTLNGTQNSDADDPGILALTNQGADGVAEGIGVQLIYNELPLKINERLLLKTSSGGQESFPITARYIQTKNQVKPGIANATATLDITYQ